MKKIIKRFALTIAMLVSVIAINAQNYQEVVYLKNGSIIRGIIFEQVPNKSLKIQTRDGNVFVYQMTEVEKITKEAPINNRSYNNFSEEEQPITFGDGFNKHYRGFLHESFTIGNGDYEINRNDLTTSHGIQILPQLFAGAGVGVSYFFNSDYDDSGVWSFPIFAHLRSEFLNKRISPYADMKIGYTIGNEIDGFYFAPTIGCHFYFGNSKWGASVGIGYTLQMADAYNYYSRSNYSDYMYGYGNSYYNNYENYYDVKLKKKNIGGFTINVALDF